MLGGDDENVLYAREHEYRKRVIDHGFVVNRQQLFGNAQCNRMQAAARATGEYDALVFHG